MMFRKVNESSPKFTKDPTHDLFAYRKKIKKNMQTELKDMNEKYEKLMSECTHSYEDFFICKLQKPDNDNSSQKYVFSNDDINFISSINLNELNTRIRNLENNELIKLSEACMKLIDRCELNEDQKKNLNEIQEYVASTLLHNLVKTNQLK